MQFVGTTNVGAVFCHKMWRKLRCETENGVRTILWDRKWSEEYVVRQKMERGLCCETENGARTMMW